MEINKFEETQQCFLDQELDDSNYLQELDMKIQISKTIKQQMPANELRTARRPENMAPRTFCLDRPYYLLKDSINESCYEFVGQFEQGKLKQRIVNSKNLSIQQYFSRKKFQCVYNKLQTYRQDSKSFLGKLKGIDSLIDYNWKFFKELEIEINLFNQVKVDRIDSDFESGNICKAYINVENADEKNQYNLLIENDINTYGYNNWFFFRFRNCQKGRRRFNIVNFIKKTSFFSQGMLISIHSSKKAGNQNIKWFKGGDKITFNTVNIIRERHQNDCYSCLSFEYDFVYENDETYFALSQPYTYTRLINLIGNCLEHSSNTKIQFKNIGYSVSNNIIPTLKFYKNVSKKDSIILILARQHPCETVGSFIMQAIMKHLMNPDPICQYLLSNFQFVVVPMVNPDGVIHGMSRCNMAGLDLNRQWGNNILKELTPQTRKIQQFITNLSKQKKIKYMIDLHGHGKKLNSFFFCCKGNQKQKQNYRLLSMSMKKLESRFNIYSCTYGITKDKQNTVRSKISSMGIRQSYTLQTSLYGWKTPKNQIKHFNQLDYQQIAKSVLSSIFLLEASPSLTTQYLGITKDMIVAQLSTMIDVIEKEERNNSQNLEVMSDSDPEGDRLDMKDLLGKCENKLMKKKIQQSYAPKPKTKRAKMSSNLQSNRGSAQNVRQSHYDSIYNMSQISQLNASIRNSLLNNSNGLNQGLVKPSTKKASFAEKWREKRKQIMEKTKIPQKRKGIQDSLNITHKRLRSRIKTEMSPIQKKKAIPEPFQRKIDCKMRLFDSKYKVSSNCQMIQAQKLLLSNNKDLEQEEVLRRSELDLRFKQLKQQSLNILLTNTLSILKINPNKKQKQRQVSVYKNISLPARDCPTTTESRNMIESVTQQKEDQQPADIQSSKYKKFKHFSNKGIYPKQKIKQSNSVFYYFPVL